MRDLLGKLNDIFDRRTKRRLAFATVGSMVIATMDTIAITLVLPLVDLAAGGSTDVGTLGYVAGVLGDPSRGALMAVLAVVVVTLFILKDVGAMAFTWWMTGFVVHERVRTSARLMRHFLSSPYSEVSRRSSSELLRTMTDSVGQVFNGTVNGLMYATSNAIAIAAVVAALLFVSPVPTLVLVAYFGIAALLYWKVVKPRAAAAGVVMSAASVDGWRWALAGLGASKELHLRGTHEHFVGHYETSSMQAASAQRTASFLMALPRYFLEVLFILAVGLVLALSTATSSDTSSGTVLGVLALFVAAGFRVLPSITGFLGSASSMRVGQSALNIVHDEVIAARDMQRSRRDPAGPAIDFTEGLVVDNVSFRYPDSQTDVLRSVSIDFPRGSSTALVGGSGAGKTTLVDIILGLHVPTDGRVIVDDTDIAGQRAQWQAIVGYVPQDVYILDATLAENVAFDRDEDEIDRQRLVHALKEAQLDELLPELSDGVQTQLGEHGARLSGGQRQRVGIARALYREPQLLVLDEATSALDNETEHRVSETIAKLSDSITVVIVAHRLSTVRNADQIVFLEKGRVQTVGTFDEVRRDNAEFARLVELGSLEPLTVRSREPKVDRING